MNIYRGTLSLVNALRKLQTLQFKGFAGEVEDNVEHFEPYGLTANPEPSSEVLYGYIGEGEHHPIVFSVVDRRYRPKGLKTGETMLYSKFGQTFYLDNQGQVVITDASGSTITMASSGDVEITPSSGLMRVNGTIEATGDIKDWSATTGKTMDGMRSTYNSHTHSDPQGGDVAAPNQQM